MFSINFTWIDPELYKRNENKSSVFLLALWHWTKIKVNKTGTKLRIQQYVVSHQA